MSIPLGNVIFELICFTAFVGICAGLLKFRYSTKYNILILTGSIVAVVCIQAAILSAASEPISLLMTLLPITAYLPVIIAVHILAKGGFAAAVATWSLGLLVPYILNLFRELMLKIQTWDESPLIHLFLFVSGSLILGSALVFAALRFCRKPFRTFEFQNKYIWIIIPAILLFMLISYIESITFEPFIAFITFLIVLVMFAFLVKFLNVAMSERIAKATEQEIARQLDMQKHELLRINQKIEQGRIYRHDMRHHLSVLKNLAENEKTEDIQKYIDSLNDRISNVGTEKFCENSVVNAVFSSYIEKGKHENIHIESKVSFPKNLPIDEFDICTILANALDNAVIACRKCQGKRWIYISSSLHENGNFSVDIKNPCETSLKFGKDGLPESPNNEEHGFGLKSIYAIVRKYNGILRCTCDDGIFRLSVVLFPQDNVPTPAKSFRLKKVLPNTAISLILAICFLNFLPDTIRAATALPVIGDAVKLLDISNYRTLFSWGSSSLEINYPQISTDIEFFSAIDNISEENDETNTNTDILNSSDTAIPNEMGEGTVSETIAPSSPNKESGITLPQIPEITISDKKYPQTSSQTKPVSEPETDSQESPSISETENQNSENPNFSTGTDQDLSDGIDEMNRQMEEYIEKVKNEFLYYFS
ncbi:MAG: GHKL domain-containing protein, partial [Clostridiales bacterium]|nr:GHKL domain-containing protein [Clostridiales bacterium]